MPSSQQLETGIKGITPEQIRPGLSMETVAQSGRPLTVQVTARSIAVRDQLIPQLRLLAYIEENLFSVDVKTKSPTFEPGRHPDLFAGKFVAFALNFFKEYGHHVPFYKSLWWGDSDNYLQWETAIKQGVLPRDALALTWEGKLRHRLGYTKLVSFEPIENLKRKDSLLISIAGLSQLD